MKLSDVTDDKSFIAFLYSMYLGRLANDGEPDDYYAVEISNQLMHAYVRVTILKIPDELDKKIMAADLGVDMDKLLKEFEILSSNYTLLKKDTKKTLKDMKKKSVNSLRVMQT